MDAALRFENVSKRYLIGFGKVGIREVFAGSFKKKSKRREEQRNNELWAIKNLCFEVGKGEALGIIGANGAGKTTTLKLLSQVTRPTSGTIITNGRISSLIELGAGFHPDLTGRDNIYLNGTIMGLRWHEIRQKFDSIVAFAELERFIDTPVKRYSSGMYARLGFAVAAHVNPDVLLVDEVLSVGDEAFQIKCRDFIHSFVNSGRTSVFVSHNLYAIDQLCHRVIWLDKGQVIENGNPAMVMRKYMDATDVILAARKDEQSITSDRIHISDLKVLDKEGIIRETFYPGEDLVIRIDYQQEGRLARPYFCIWISEAQAHLPLFAANMLLDNYYASTRDGPNSLTCIFEKLPLMPRAYQVWVEVYGEDRSKLLYSWRVLGGFRMLEGDVQIDQVGSLRFKRSHGVIKVPYKWSQL